jgi:hypothetical protein
MGFSTFRVEKKSVNADARSKHAQHATERGKVSTIARDSFRALVEGPGRFPQVHSPYY